MTLTTLFYVGYARVAIFLRNIKKKKVYIRASEHGSSLGCAKITASIFERVVIVMIGKNVLLLLLSTPSWTTLFCNASSTKDMAKDQAYFDVN